MIAKYYIQKGKDAAKDIYATYKIYVLESKGLWDLPTPKKSYEEDWADKNGKKVYESTKPVYDAMDGSINFAILGDIATVKANLKAFYSYITNVVPADKDAAYGSSAFSMYNDVWGSTTKPKIRCTGFDTGAKLQYKKVEDMQDPNKLVSAYTFTLKFSVDQPTLIF